MICPQFGYSATEIRALRWMREIMAPAIGSAILLSVALDNAEAKPAGTALREDDNPMVLVAQASLSGYCACRRCTGKTDGITASGTKAAPGRTLAAPRQIPFGRRIWSDGKLLGIVEDRGSAITIKDGIVHLDIFFASHAEALKFGRKDATVLIEKKETDRP